MPADDSFPLNEEELAALKSEPRGFTPEQMVTCEVCLRSNAPTRSSCMYCAAALPATEQTAAQQQPTLRPLEKWEQGFNSILLPPGDASLAAVRLEELARLLRLTDEEARRIVEQNEPLPLARTATEQEAQLVERRLRELGLRVLTVADEELALDAAPPRRIRALELTAEALVAWPTGGNEALRTPWDEITLLLTGRVVTRQVEVEERRRRRAEKEIVETRELSADDALLDLYPNRQQGSWRILAGHFDFSCLGAKKQLLASQNFLQLLEELRGHARAAVYDDSYLRVRHALGAVWPLEQQTESRGWRRGGPGRYRTEAVTTSDNEKQFTRYSRLRHYLLSRAVDDRS